VATIRKSIGVPGVRSEVATAWARFVDSVLVGRRRLACDELTCIDPAGRELVGFQESGDARTRVSVTIPMRDGASDGEAELLGHKASHDLVLFLDYLESGEYKREHPPDEVAAAALREDVSRGRRTPYQGRPDVESLSVRRSGRT
jgi:hypothetical protein